MLDEDKEYELQVADRSHQNDLNRKAKAHFHLHRTKSMASSIFDFMVWMKKSKSSKESINEMEIEGIFLELDLS